jgi:hypothetical protein
MEVPSDEAFDVAYMKALEKCIEATENEQQKAFYQWPLTRLTARPIQLDPTTLKSYVGTYGPRTISLENGTLFYQRSGGLKYELYPYGTREFMLKETDTFRIRFIAENNKVTAIQGLYEDGHTDQNRKGN